MCVCVFWGRGKWGTVLCVYVVGVAFLSVEMCVCLCVLVVVGGGGGGGKGQLQVDVHIGGWGLHRFCFPKSFNFN